VSDPAKRTPTEAMRLKPATRPGAPAEVVHERTADEALGELLELHSSASVVDLCRECLLPHPCRTRQLAEIVAGTRATPPKGSQ
jgi:hypothetical protein